MELPVTNMKSKNFNFVVLSDIHLGNKRNTSEEIISNLEEHFKDNQAFSELDLIVLAGDIFDSLLNSIDVLIIDVWIARFLRLCKKHDVLVYVLEGTPSHDWMQSSRFIYINEKISNIDANIIYIKDLSIWYEEKFDMNFLFVPDEWSASTEQTLSQVRDLLRNKGLKQVDYAFMHGNFEFQIPSHIRIQKHDSRAYLELVKYNIYIGHIHNYSNFERIYAQGSFDRLSHGEEEPKGYLKTVMYPDGHNEVTFIENKNAKKFTTLDCIKLTVDEIIEKAKKETSELPQGSYVRILAEYQNPIFTSMDIIMRNVPHCQWSKHPKDLDGDKDLSVTSIDEQEGYIPIEIHKGNIRELMVNRLNSLPIETTVHKKAVQYLDDILM